MISDLFDAAKESEILFSEYSSDSSWKVESECWPGKKLNKLCLVLLKNLHVF